MTEKHKNITPKYEKLVNLNADSVGLMVPLYTVTEGIITFDDME